MVDDVDEACRVKAFLSSVKNSEFIMLKLGKVNRDYDVFCSKNYAEAFIKEIRTNEVEHIILDYIYVKRLYVFGNLNVAIDLITEPRIKYRVYSFKRIKLELLGGKHEASKEQNLDWRDFQKNVGNTEYISSKISFRSVFDYIVIILNLQFKVLGITFSGPDGSGKSSAIEKTQLALEVMRVPHRLKRQVFGILPRPAALIGRKPNIESENRNPNSGKQKNLFVSFFVSLYYLGDYILGKMLWIFRSNKYEVIVFDRYIMDFLVNIERNALHLKVTILFKVVSTFLELGFKHYLCYAPAAVIGARKDELDVETIERLNRGYLDLDVDWNVWKCW